MAHLLEFKVFLRIWADIYWEFKTMNWADNMFYFTGRYATDLLCFSGKKRMIKVSVKRKVRFSNGR